MGDNFQTIDIRKLKELLPLNSNIYLGDDFLIAEIKPEGDIEALKYPLRFDGYISVFCIKGRLSVDINLNTYELTEHTVLIDIPGYIVRISDFGTLNDGDTENSHFILVALSQNFVSDLRFDFTRLFNESMTLMDNPCFKFENEDLDLPSKYLVLAMDIMKSDIGYKKEALNALVTSLLYTVSSKWTEKIMDARNSATRTSVRSKMVFEQFLKLVNEYHSSQRNMAFYADKLCLTPKYLSKLVEQVSGRSAPDWIDSFVILEAKNMLRYSDTTIKEIVYKLHFPNQSVFYKFFKTHTGMTPSEYRNS